MFLLVRKSNLSIVRQWTTLPNRVPHPTKLGGALSIGPPAPLPFHYSSYVLLQTVDVGFEPFNPITQVRTGPVFDVKPGPTATATWIVREKTQAELDVDQDRFDIQGMSGEAINMARLLIELMNWVVANTPLPLSALSSEVRATYLRLRAINERMPR